MSADFQFVESTHTYTRGGIVIPSATRCLEFAGLSNYDNVRSDILERRSDLGRKVHAATQYYDEGELDLESCGAQTKNYLKSWIAWREARKFVPLHSERRQIGTLNGMPFGMTFDRYGLLDGIPTVVELKITRQIMREHGIQLAFYAAGAEVGSEAHMSPQARFALRRRYVVRLREDGGLAQERQFSDPVDYTLAAAALTISLYKLSEGEKIPTIEEDK